MRTKEEIKAAFTPVSPLSSTQQVRLMKVQAAFIDLATDIEDLVPESADRTDALRKLLECKFMTVQALTHFREPPVGKNQGKDE